MKQRHTVSSWVVSSQGQWINALAFGLLATWFVCPSLSVAEEVVAQEAESESQVVYSIVEIDTEDEVALVEVSAAETEAAENEAGKEECASKKCATKKCDSTKSATAVAIVKEKPKKIAKHRKKSGKSFLSLIFSSGKEEEPKSVDESKYPATHQQVALLKVGREGAGDKKSGQAGWSIQSFCLDGEDNLLVAVNDNGQGKLELLDATGSRLRSLDLPVVPEAINVDADGNLLVAGQGKMFRIDAEGVEIVEAASPLITQLEEQKDEIREQVIQQIKDQAKMMVQQKDIYQQQMDQIYTKAARRLDRADHKEYVMLKGRIDKFTEESADKLSVEEQNAWALRKVLFRMHSANVEAKLDKSDKQMLKVYKQQMEYFKDYDEVQAGAEPTDEQVDKTLASMIEYKSKIASISATGDEVFIATGAVTGYGYDVWRFDASLENPEKIVTQLRGCCGQMDVQACDGGLYVAENSRHKVQHFDLKGEKVNSWGSGNREGVTGFGSCCNPMNVAFGPDGSVYTAESGSGRIKRYSQEGELMALVGSVELVPGCKKVSIAVSKDQQRVYMLDITRNHIVVMEAKPADEQKVASK